MHSNTQTHANKLACDTNRQIYTRETSMRNDNSTITPSPCVLFLNFRQAGCHSKLGSLLARLSTQDHHMAPQRSALRGAGKVWRVSFKAKFPPLFDRILQPAPCVTFSGKACELDVHVVWNGRCNTHGVDNVGTVPAALSTYIAAQAFKPQVIISAGTAGGFKSKVRQILHH